MPAIETKNLRKEFKIHDSRQGLAGAFRDLFNRKYKTVTAVDGVNLLIEEGEMVGYIGENGAGKSTTIKMLTGILSPTSGELRVNGMNPHREREAFVRTIGVVFGQRSQLWWDIAVRESFRLLKKVYRVSDRDYQKQMDHVIEVLEIGDLLSQPVRKLSLGQRMRCELAAAFVHNPRLLFLDEPTIGLDVLVKLKIREFLKEMNQEYGTTILLTTHDISDIEALCKRVVMLDRGKIVYDGSLQALRDQFGGQKKVTMEFTHSVPLEQLEGVTRGLGIVWAQENPFRFQAAFINGGMTISELITRVAAHFPVKDLQVSEASTEEIIRQIYEEGMMACTGR